MRSVKTLDGSGCTRIVIYGSTRKRELTPTVELTFEVGIGIFYACISYIGSQRHGVERHLQIHRNILQFQAVQRYPPVQGGFNSIFRSLGSIGKYYLHMGITQLHAIQHGILFFQVDAVALEEEPSERSFDVHTFQQGGRVYGYLLQSNIVHLYPALQQRPRLHAHVQASKVQQGIGMLHIDGVVLRLHHLYATHKQIQGKTKVNPFYGNIHARSIRRYRRSLFPYKILHGRHIQQYHQYYK